VSRAPARDPETRLTGDQHASLRLWLRLYTCTRLIETAMRRRLATGFGITLARFDLLAQLERLAGGLTMSELSGQLLVTGGNVTGIVTQLERDGLVTRASGASDRRTVRVQLTPLGRRRFREMAADHERWIVETLSGLGARRQRDLGALLAALKRLVREREEESHGPHGPRRHLRAG
jgi:DNA-binding MarR family transcriptional regulator